MKIYTAFVAAIWIAAVSGWIANIVKLIGMIGGDISLLAILRIIGIFAAPLGALLGFL